MRPAGALRRLAAVALVSWGLLVSGCAMWRGEAPARESDAGAPTGPPAVRVEIAAPPDLQALLERHLDLSRLAVLTRGDAVTDTELQRLLDGAPAQVRELLQTEGYFKPNLSIQRTQAVAPGLPETVRVRVEHGPRARISRVTLQAEGALERDAGAGESRARSTLADWRAAWPLRAGDLFRNADWSEAKVNALTRLRSAGYAAAAWSGTAAEVDADNAALRLFLVVDSGPLFRSGTIEVEGLTRQNVETVRALAGFAPGTPVTEGLLLDYQERLQKAGLFESVTVTLDPDPERAERATLQVRLREQPIQVYTVGVGISANTGPRASLEHVYRRVFGHAVSSTNKFELGRVRQAWTGEISTHPGENSSRWLLGGTIERLVSDDDVVSSQRLRLGRAQDTRSLERLLFAEVERGVRSTDAGGKTSIFALSGNAHFVLRKLDSVLLPTEGYTLSLQGGLGRSHGSASRTGWFARSYGRLTYYQPLGASWYGQARIEAGHVFLQNGVAAPDSQLFRAGGDDSVRGYAYRTLGPVSDGVVGSGTVLLTGSLELARPFVASMPSLWGAVFVDAGRAGNSFSGLSPALGYGAGVRWRSPVGPLKLDLAWGQETKRFRLHFSVGIAF